MSTTTNQSQSSVLEPSPTPRTRSTIQNQYMNEHPQSCVVVFTSGIEGMAATPGSITTEEGFHQEVSSDGYVVMRINSAEYADIIPISAFLTPFDSTTGKIIRDFTKQEYQEVGATD